MKKELRKTLGAFLAALEPLFALPRKLEEAEQRITKLEARPKRVRPYAPRSGEPRNTKERGPENFHGEVHITPEEGNLIRADLGRMSRDKVYEKWAKPRGKYTKPQVAAALAWSTGKLKGILRAA